MVDQLQPLPELAPDGRDTSAATAVPAWLAAIAGVVAAAVALAVGELVTSLPGSDQSLVASVGTSFIDRFAASLKDVAISIFGTNDKAALIIGIVVVALAAGAVTGILARTRTWVPFVVFGGFALLGIAATSTDTLASAPIGVVAAGLAALAGIMTLRGLLHVARLGRNPVLTTASVTRARPAGDDGRSRRAFFGWVGAAGAFAVVVAGIGRTLTTRSRAEEARAGVRLPSVKPEAGATTTVPADAPLGIDGLSPYYVPNKSFYRIDTALVVPQVDPADWKLSVTGMVDHPLTLSFDELLALPMVEESVTLSCVSNEVGGDLVGNARWQGVPLASVLERAGVQPAATQLMGVSVDGFTAGFPTQVALDGRTALIAVGMNGEALPIAHGFPARLVIAGLYGYVSATKWLTEIRLNRLEDEDGYWIDKGWSKQAPIKTMSRIDVPTTTDAVKKGPVKIAGVAWAPDVGIDKVEVQIKDGPWQPARLAEVVSKNTWVQWVYDWDAQDDGAHKVRCRATDKSGYTQTAERSSPAPDGATGYHEVQIRVV